MAVENHWVQGEKREMRPEIIPLISVFHRCFIFTLDTSPLTHLWMQEVACGTQGKYFPEFVFSHCLWLPSLNLSAIY
jgi:hypothetical protein